MPLPHIDFDPTAHEVQPPQASQEPQMALLAHLRQCQFAIGPAHRMHAMAQRAMAFASPRTISVLLLVALLCVALLSIQFGSP
jgi:hypothetical protein